MKFSPINIEQQEFNKALRGYDVQEVKTYLENVASELGVLIDENTKLKQELARAQRKNEEFQKIEKSLQTTLLSAQENSSKALEEAQRKTSEMLNDAHIKADQLVSDARKESAYLTRQVTELREEKNLLIARLKAIVETQAKVLGIGVKNFGQSGNNKTGSGDDINIDEIVEKLL